MIAAAIAATLVIQTFGGPAIIKDDVTEAACQEAKCALDRGESCAAAKADDEQARRMEEASRAQCRSQGDGSALLCPRPFLMVGETSTPMSLISPGTINRVRCVP